MTASEEAFDGFVRATSPRLLRAAWLLVGDWAAAEDLVQTAFEKTWPRWDSLVDDKQRLAYLHRVLTNAFLRGRRRKWMGEITTGDLPHRRLPMRPMRWCCVPLFWPRCAGCRRGSGP